MLPLILIIVYFFITEFIPNILALDSSFLATYIVVEESEDDLERISIGRKISEVFIMFVYSIYNNSKLTILQKLRVLV